MNFKTTTALCALALATGLLTVPDANADTQSRWLMVNAPGACQSSLPVFDGDIRKRPRAVQNEGSASAFVSCAYYQLGPFAMTGAYVYVSTNDGVADTLTCTGINGYNTGPTLFVVKTVDLPADGSQVLMAFNTGDFSDDLLTFPNAMFSLNCNLNPGVGINDAAIYFDEDIGA